LTIFTCANLSPLPGSELRKKKKERAARRKRGEEVFSDEDDI
jgi:elongation factor 3